MALTIDSMVTLNNGMTMPMLGFGTWQVPESPVGEQAVATALEVGYRLIDTAAAYGNEQSVGAAVAASGVDRHAVFITSKVWGNAHGMTDTSTACRASLRRLGMNYLDLYLIHWPTPRWPDIWRAMLDLQQAGLCRAIGVSNFGIDLLEALRAISPVPPAVNQVPFSPSKLQPELRAYCRDHDIAFEGYSPLQGSNLRDPRLREIARRHGKSPAQVIIRWSLQHDAITIPKSTHRERIRENAAVFDFNLDEQEMNIIDGTG